MQRFKFHLRFTVVFVVPAGANQGHEHHVGTGQRQGRGRAPRASAIEGIAVELGAVMVGPAVAPRSWPSSNASSSRMLIDTPIHATLSEGLFCVSFMAAAFIAINACADSRISGLQNFSTAASSAAFRSPETCAKLRPAF